MGDLRGLIAKVEAGTLNIRDLMILEPHEQIWAWRAFGGSLDAAKALHEALLPERYGVALQYCKRYAAKAIICGPMDGSNWQSGDEWIDPARAWLLAVLRALEAEGGK